MPTKLRDYECIICEHVFEYLSHGDDDQPDCPECGSKKVEITLGTPLVTKLHDPDTLKAALKKRSADDTLKQIKGHAGHKGSLPKDFGRKRMY